MKRLLSLLLILGLLPVAIARGGQTQNTGVLGKWYQSGEQGSWELELFPDGTGKMRNAGHETDITWKHNQISEDIASSLEIYINEDGEQTLLDDMLFADGVLEGEDGRKFSREKPAVVNADYYEAAKFAPLSAFDGIWELTGGILMVEKPPIQKEITPEELSANYGLPLPIYVGIKNGRLFNYNEGDAPIPDPGLDCYYLGNAIYVNRPGFEGRATFYYVHPGILHMRNAEKKEAFGVEVVFVLRLTDLKVMPFKDDGKPYEFPMRPPGGK